MSLLEVKGAGYLILRQHPVNPREMKMRYTVGKPSLASDEIAVRISVTVPASAFTAPIPAVEISVPATSVVVPTVQVLGPEDSTEV